MQSTVLLAVQAIVSRMMRTIGSMPQIFHVLCEGEERMLGESAQELPGVVFLDRAGDELFRIAQEAKAADPDGACDLTPYLNLMCSKNEHGEFDHPVAPARHEAADAQALFSAAWDLARTAAVVCKAHPHLDDASTLKLAQELQSYQTESNARIDAWASARQKEMRP